MPAKPFKRCRGISVVPREFCHKSSGTSPSPFRPRGAKFSS